MRQLVTKSILALVQQVTRGAVNARVRGYCLVILSGLLITTISSTHAEQIKNIYQQDELVLDQSVKSRRQAASRALQTVLIRVSGTTAVAQSAPVRAALSNPEALLQSFRYQSSTEMIERDGEELPATQLVMSFSATGVESLLRRASLPIWPANRPSVLLWLVRDDLQMGRQFVDLQDLDNPVAEEIVNSARQRGLPLTVPLLDLQDRLALGPDDVWRLDGEAVREASLRYQADAILIGRYSQTSSGQWLATWTLLHKDRREVFDSDGMVETQVAQQGIEASAAYLADIYAVATADSAPALSITLDIESIHDFAQYAAALKYIEGLHVVNQLQLVQVKASRIRVQLEMQGDLTLLINGLDLDGKLVPADPDTASLSSASIYRLQNQGSSVDSRLGNKPLRFRWAG